MQLLLLQLSWLSFVPAEFNIDDSVLFKVDFPGIPDTGRPGRGAHVSQNARNLSILVGGDFENVLLNSVPTLVPSTVPR